MRRWAAFSLGMLSAFAAAAAVNRWTSHGPFGGVVISLVVDPTNPSIAYAGMNTGVFKTTDGAASWTWVSKGLPTLVDSLTVDTGHPSNVYFAAGANRFGGLVHKSADGGRTWTVLTPISLNSPFLPGKIAALAVDPKSSNTIYAGVSLPGHPVHGSGYRALIYATTDGGATWQERFGIEGIATSILVDAGDSSIIYALLSEPYRSTDGGITWNPMGPAGVTGARSLVQSATLTLYLGTSGHGIFRSDDHGLTWLPANGGLTGDALGVGSVTAPGASAVYAATGAGIFGSVDGGSSWELRSNEWHPVLVGVPLEPSVLYSFNNQLGSPDIFDGISKSIDAGRTWSIKNQGLRAYGLGALAVDPSSPTTLYVGAFGPVFKSVDRGVTWTEHPFVRFPRQLLVDPFDSEVIYAATSPPRRSIDGGETWASFEGNLTGEDRFVASFAADSRDSGTLYAGTTTGRLFRTRDAGVSWTAIGPSEADNGDVYDTSIALDPAGVLYFGTQRGLFRSGDGGATWQATEIVDDVRAIAAQSNESGWTYASSSSGLYRTRDDGHTWQRVSDALAHSIAIRPNHPFEVHVAQSGRVLRSLDGGVTFHPENNGLVVGPQMGGGVGNLAWDSEGAHLFAAGVGVFEFEPANVVTIPAVSSLHGAPPTFFHSDVTVFNTSRGPEPAAVTATYRCMGDACEEQTRTFTVPPRGLVSYDDIVGGLFESPETAGTVELASDRPLVVTSRLYTPERPSPTLGMHVPGLQTEQSYPLTVLTSLSHSPEPARGSRTNIGIYNPADVEQTAQVSCRDIGSNLFGTVTRTVGPRELVQINDADLFAEIGIAVEVPNFYCVVQGTPDQSLFTYAAVIDNQSQDSTFIVGRDASQFDSLRAVLPAAASLHGAGGTFFHTDASILNASLDTTLIVTARYRCSLGNCVPGEQAFILSPLQVRPLEDLAGQFLGAPDSGGAVEVTAVPSPSFGPAKVVVTSRLYTPSHPSPTVGMFVPGLTPGEATVDAVLTSLSRSSAPGSGFRTNVGAFNPGDQAQTLLFDLYDAGGIAIGHTSRRLGNLQAVQINDIFREVGVENVEDAYCLVRGDGLHPFHAYAAVIDNQSQDPIFVTGQSDVGATLPQD